MGLASQFQERVANYKEYRRLIDRERGMVDETALILLDDFYQHALQPLLAGGTPLSRFFAQNGVKLYHGMRNMMQDAYTQQYLLRPDCLDPRMRDYLHRKQAFMEAGCPEDQIFDIIPLTRYMPDDQDKDVWISYHLIKDAPANFARNLQCLHLGDFLALADESAFMGHAIDRHEFYSLLTDQGNSVLQFWRNVRQLKDYSGFFPHKPKPQGNNHHRKREERFAAGLKPSFS